MDKYQCLIGKKILPPKQHSIIERAQSAYSLLGKALGKQVKIVGQQEEKQREGIEEQGEKQLLALNEDIKKDDDTGFPTYNKDKDREIVKDSLDKAIAKICLTW